MPIIICQGWGRRTNSAYTECNAGQPQDNCDAVSLAGKWKVSHSIELDAFSRAFALSLVTGMPAKSFLNQNRKEHPV